MLVYSGLIFFGLLRNPYRAVLEYVSSAYHIALARERERVRKQCDFAPKNAIHFVSKRIIFQKVESDTSENLQRPISDKVSVYKLNVIIVKSYFDPNKFQKYFS